MGTDPEKRREKQNLEREVRRSLGLCPGCGDVASEGRIRCARCIQAGRAAQDRMKKRRHEAGLCLRCGKVPPRVDATMCEPCAKRWSGDTYAYIVRRRAERRELGLCFRCDAPIANAKGAWSERTYCAACGAVEHERTLQAVKRRRERLAAEGICTNCGKSEAARPSKLCITCIQSRNSRQRKIREVRSSLSLCSSCGENEVTGDDTRCDTCTALAAERRRKGVRKRLVKGLCARCGKNPNVAGSTDCAGCLEHRRTAQLRLRDDRVTAGICMNGDGARTDGTRYCESCRLKHREILRARSELGICQRCPRPAVPGRSRCSGCLAQARLDEKQRSERRRSARD